MYNYFGGSMKKIIAFLSILVLLTGCTPIKKEDSTKKDDKTKEPEVVATVPEEIEPPEPEYIDTNPIKLAAYDSNGYFYYRSSEKHSPYVKFMDWAEFNVFLCDDESLSYTGVVNTYESCKARYSNANEYKTGFNVTFTYGPYNEVFNQTAKGVESWLETNGFLLIYFYDSIYHRNDSWYSHTTVDEYNDNTQITGIKITGGDNTDQINSDITITIFTYKDDNDFDKDGNYRGNSKFTFTIIKS